MLTYRRLNPETESDVNDLQTLFEAASDYHQLVESQPPPPDAAEKALTERPAGTTPEDKHVFGIQQAGKLIGCFDLVKGYPDPETAFIGLLLFPESERGKSHGTEVLHYIEALATEWGCRRLRLAVIETNKRALTFWKRKGFSECYRKPSDGHTGRAIVMERSAA